MSTTPHRTEPLTATMKVQCPVCSATQWLTRRGKLPCHRRAGSKCKGSHLMPIPKWATRRGIDRERMWATLPADGSWLTLNAWRSALGCEDASPMWFGRAAAAADVGVIAVYRGERFYRRRTECDKYRDALYTGERRR